MIIKAIIELQAQPGKRDKFLKALDQFHESRKNAPGFLGAEIYEGLDDPNLLVEISEWESREARQGWLENNTASLGHLASTLRGAIKAVTVRQINAVDPG